MAEECGCEGMNDYGLTRGGRCDRSECKFGEVSKRLAEAEDLIDYILKNSLGGWAGRTVDEVERFKKRRGEKK